jgi:hypothetical protein
MVADIRAAIEATGCMPGADVMVSATHTHAGPDLDTGPGQTKGARTATLRFALPGLSPRRGGQLDGVRRSRTWRRRCWPGPRQPVSGVGRGTTQRATSAPQRLSVLTARREGELGGMVLVHPCHGTVLGPNNLAVSRATSSGPALRRSRPGRGRTAAAPGRRARRATSALGAAGGRGPRARPNVWALSSPPPLRTPPAGLSR